MIISIIVAVSENGIIGSEGKLPWKLPVDLKRFKKLTTGKAVIMGRKTFESLPIRPLPDRMNVIISRQENLQIDGCVVLHSFEEAIERLKDLGFKEVFVMGGEEIYRKALDFCSIIYLTKVRCFISGDTRFPLEEVEKTWYKVSCIEDKHEAGTYTSNFCIYLKPMSL